MNTPPQNKTLFVLDDDAIFHRIMTLANRHNAFRDITPYYNVKVLLAYLLKYRNDHKNLPDVIFVDLGIPVSDGWHFLYVYNRIYNSICKNIEIYVVTVSVNKSDNARMSAYPFVKQYITKPISMDQFRMIGKVEVY